MTLKNLLKDYFSFSRRDRTGIITLTSLIVVIYCLPFFLAGRHHEPVIANDVLALAIDSLQIKEKNSYQARQNNRPDPNPKEINYQAGEVFRFDPNTLSVAGWQRLGLAEKTALTIDKYRQKGGRFYKTEDLQRIWGLPEGFYERVKSYIDLPVIENRSIGYDKKPLDRPKLKPFDINQADSTAFIALPGIGQKLASRIIGFREKLGGFYSVSQVKETYGLADSTFQKIQPLLKLESPPKQININTATKEQLRAHPYFKWNLANAIIEYRNQHGPFRSIEGLRQVALVDEILFHKIKPYLVLE